MIKRLAVLADIHAIMPVLDQALAEIEQLGVEGIIVAGDMLAGPNPVEVLQRLRTYLLDDPRKPGKLPAAILSGDST